MTDPTPDVKSLFGQALERPPAERAAFLDVACAGHPAVRAELDALLAALDRAGDFLNPPDSPARDEATLDAPVADSAATRSVAAEERPGVLVAGRYKLLQQIGEGGMGTVWMADQVEPVKRRVAVKLIREERGNSKTILSRFEAERQAIALMDHPHIAKLLDAGTSEAGQPFFVMELVKGVPLTDYFDAHRLSIPDRLTLFAQICSAVQHAHQKGVIHRDLKPTNILVESHDGRAVPKVIDFGLAKATSGLQLTDHTLFTAFGSVMGTPLYMAPEQATFNAVDVDTRADVYALGVILYELLCGTTPLTSETVKKAALDEMLKLIRDQEAPPPSSRLSATDARPSIAANRQTEPAKLSRLMKGELDWIVLRALAKERERRYESAAALARDVGRHLTGEAVEACPPTLGYRLRKAYRRNKAAVWVSTAFTLLMTVGVAVASLLAVRARDAEVVANANAERANENAEQARDAERKEAEQRELAQKKAEEAIAARDDARRTHYAAQMNLAYQKAAEADGPDCVRMLEELVPKPGEADLRGPEWFYWMKLFRSEERVVPIPELARAWKVEFNRTGTHFAYTLPTNDQPGEPRNAVVRVHSLPEGRLVREITTRHLEVKNKLGQNLGHFLSLSDDGRRILVSTTRQVTVYDTANGKELYSDNERLYAIPDGPFGGQSGVALSGDGLRLCLCTYERKPPPGQDGLEPARRDHLFRTIDLETGKTTDREGDVSLERFIVSCDGTRFVYSTQTEVVVAKTDSGEVQQRLKIPTLPDAKIGSSASPLLFANQQFSRLALVIRPMVLTTSALTGAECFVHVWRVSTGELLSSSRHDGLVDPSLSYRDEPVVGRPAVSAAPWNKLSKPGIPVISPYGGSTIQTIRHTAKSLVTCADNAGHVFGLSDRELHVWAVRQPRRMTDPRGVGSNTGSGEVHRFLDMTPDAGRFAYFSYQLQDRGESVALQGRLTVASGERGPIVATTAVTEDQVADLKFRQSNVGFSPDGRSLMGVSSRLTNPKDRGSMVSRLWRWDFASNRLAELGETWPTVGVSSSAIASTYAYEQWREDRVGERVAAVTARPKPGGGSKYALAILQSKDGRRVGTTDYSDGELFSPKWSQDGKTLFAFAENRAVGWLEAVEFDANTFRLIRKVRYEGVFQKDDWDWQMAGSHLVFGRDPVVRDGGRVKWSSLTVRDSTNGVERATIREPGLSISLFSITADGTAVAVLYAGRGGVFKLYALPDAREITSAPVDPLYFTRRPFFTPDGRRLLIWKSGQGVTGNSRALAVYDTTSGRYLADLPIEGGIASSFVSAASSADGTKLVTGYRTDSEEYGPLTAGDAGLRVFEVGPLPDPKK